MLLENLTTERLRFRRFQAADEVALLDFFEDPEATRLFSIFENPRSHARARIAAQIRRYEKDGDGLCAIVDRKSGALIGQAGLLWQEVDGMRELEVAYHLQPQHWKKGYATEAAIACREFVASRQLAPSVISIIDVRNSNSQRVAIRNGMQREKEILFKGKAVYIYRFSF